MSPLANNFISYSCFSPKEADVGIQGSARRLFSRIAFQALSRKGAFAPSSGTARKLVKVGSVDNSTSKGVSNSTP